ncbi:hypothetical protein Tco_1033067 [Tanacetum coccineum]|uniref:Uncharacterized protein n=1 Tax=Tanacetum coccineum TaxID=301880 RepID=A0ABQ5GEY6_9ASTR
MSTITSNIRFLNSFYGSRSWGYLMLFKHRGHGTSHGTGYVMIFLGQVIVELWLDVGSEFGWLVDGFWHGLVEPCGSGCLLCFGSLYCVMFRSWFGLGPFVYDGMVEVDCVEFTVWVGRFCGLDWHGLDPWIGLLSFVLVLLVCLVCFGGFWVDLLLVGLDSFCCGLILDLHGICLWLCLSGLAWMEVMSGCLWVCLTGLRFLACLWTGSESGLDGMDGNTMLFLGGLDDLDFVDGGLVRLVSSVAVDGCVSGWLDSLMFFGLDSCIVFGNV